MAVPAADIGRSSRINIVPYAPSEATFPDAAPRAVTRPVPRPVPSPVPGPIPDPGRSGSSSDGIIFR